MCLKIAVQYLNNFLSTNGPQQMQELNPSYFFNLSSYKHKEVFENSLYVWQALSHISHYLSSYQLGKIEVEIPKGVHLINPELISIGKGSVIEPGCYIKGPCILGDNCTVRHGAYIRGDLIAGKECVIGHTTEVKQAILLDGVHADHFAYVGNAILGNQAHLGAGVKLANLKLDSSEIIIHFEGKNYPTGLKKFGAIIGDKTQLGCNAVTNPGTLLGKETFCYPTLNIGGFVPSYHTVKPSQNVLVIPRKQKN